MNITLSLFRIKLLRTYLILSTNRCCQCLFSVFNIHDSVFQIDALGNTVYVIREQDMQCLM